MVRQPKTEDHMLSTQGINAVWQGVCGGKSCTAFEHLMPMSAKRTQSRSAAGNAAPERVVPRACLAHRPQWTIGLSSRTVWRVRRRENLVVRRRDLSRKALLRRQLRWTNLHCVSDQPRVGMHQFQKLTEWNARRRARDRLRCRRPLSRRRVACRNGLQGTAHLALLAGPHRAPTAAHRNTICLRQTLRRPAVCLLRKTARFVRPGMRGCERTSSALASSSTRN